MSEAIQGGCLYIVSTPIGNLEDITIRATRILAGVDVIAAEDTRKTRILLDHLSIAKPMISYHSHNEVRRVPEILCSLAEGKSVALVTDAGTPGVSDPAFLVTRAAVEAGFTVVPIPGASAVLAALVASGLPMDRFAFEGFLPPKKGRKTRLEQLRVEHRTIVIYESPFRVLKTLDEIAAVIGERNVAVARELTKKFEEIVRGRVSDVLQRLRLKEPRGEYVIVIEGNRARKNFHQD